MIHIIINDNCIIIICVPNFLNIRLLKNCRKIGEGVYGEVFLWRARDGRARVLKVIPIAGDIKVNGEEQKGFHEILSEIVIAMLVLILMISFPIH